MTEDKRQPCKILKTTSLQVIYYPWSDGFQEEDYTEDTRVTWIDSDNLPIIEDCIREIILVNKQQSELAFGQYKEFVSDIRFEVNGELLYSLWFEENDVIRVNLPKGKSFLWKEGMNIGDLIKPHDVMIPRDVTIHYTTNTLEKNL
jgi:hypothetical protein